MFHGLIVIVEALSVDELIVSSCKQHGDEVHEVELQLRLLAELSP